MRPSHATTSRSLALAIVFLMAVPVVPAQDLGDTECMAKVIAQDPHWPIHIDGEASTEAPQDALAGICTTESGYEVTRYTVTADPMEPTSLGMSAPHVSVNDFHAGELVISEIELQEVLDGDEFSITDSTDILLEDIEEPEAQVYVGGSSDSIRLDDVEFDTITIDTTGAVTISNFDAHQIIVKNGAVRLEFGELNPPDEQPGVVLEGGSLTIGFGVGYHPVDAACIQTYGGSLTFDAIFWQAGTMGTCPHGIVDGTLDSLDIQQSQFSLPATFATLFKLNVEEAVRINNSLFANDGPGFAFGGPADVTITNSEFRGQSLPLTIAGTGTWRVERNSFSGLDTGLAAADGATATLVFLDNMVDGTPTFIGTPQFDDQVTTTLSQAVQPGTNILGHGLLGGNAWSTQELADGDGDGIAQEAFTPPGTSVMDLAPIVQPNFQPNVTLWTTPDHLATGTLFDVGSAISVRANATDPDDAPADLYWRIYALDEAPPAFNLGAEAIQTPITFATPGVHTIGVDIMDAAGAVTSTSLDVFVEAPNQAPIIDSMTVGTLTGSACTPLGDTAQIYVGTELCMTSSSHDPDAGVMSRRDGIYVDSDGDGTAGLADARLDVPLPKGIAGYTKIRGQALLPLAGGLASDADGGLYIDLGCDGIADRGDIRLANVTLPITLEGAGPVEAQPADANARLRDIDFDHGRALGPCQQLSFGYVDLDADGLHTPADILVAGTGTLPLNVQEGMLRIAPVGPQVNATDALLGEKLVPLPDAQLAWDDADGDLSVTWRVGTALLRGESVTTTARELGSYAIHAVVTDRGVPKETAAQSKAVDVISANPPDIDITLTPSTMIDGTHAVSRAREITIRDATRAEVNTGIVEQDWAISWTDLAGDQHLVDSTDRPEWQNAEEITFTFDDHRIRYVITHSVELRNGQGTTMHEEIRVLRTPPTPVVEFTPAEGIMFGDVVTFAADGSIDQGDALSHAGEYATVGNLLIADVDANGVLSAPDMPFQAIDVRYPTLTKVAASDLDVQRTRGHQLDTHVCLRDNDLDLIADPGEELYLDLSGPCTAMSVMPGLLRIYSPDLGTGVLVGAQDVDIGSTTVHLPDAVLATIGDQYVIDLDGNGSLDIGELILGPSPSFSEAPAGPVVAAEMARAWGSLYAFAAPGADVPADSLRLTESFVQHPGMTPLAYAAGNWIGQPPLASATRHVCYADVLDGDEAYSPGEPLFLTSEPCSTAALGDIRLQPQNEATGGLLAAGTAIGSDSALPGILHPDVGLALRSLPAAKLAEHEDFIALDLDGDLSLDAGELRLEAVQGRDAASRVNGPTGSDNPGADADLRYRWECRVGCGDPKVVGTGGTVSYAFQSSGRKEVVLIVGDEDGNIVEQPISLAVGNTPPIPGVSITRLAYPNGAETFLATQNQHACNGLCPPVAGANDRDTLRLDGTASFDPDGPKSALLYEWALPDGNILVGPQVEVSFTDPGVYSIVLTVTDSDDLDARSDQMTLQVEIGNGLPEADFVVKTPQPITLSPVLFDGGASSDPGGEIVHYEWTFESDVGDIKRTGRTTTFTWEKPGTYDVSLRVFDDHADSSPVLQSTVLIANRAPFAVAEVDLPARLPPAEFQFTARDSYDLDGAISSYVWDFGDGSTGNGADVSHVYDTRGSFDVSLTVTDDQGATSVSELQVIVLNKPALLSVAIPSSATAGTAIPLEAVVQDPEKGAVTVAWTIKDSTGAVIQELTGASVQATFPNWGTYTIIAVATDDAGAETTVTRNVKVASRAPIATLTADTQTIQLGEKVTLTGSATDPDGTIKGHYLDFGDGDNVFAASAEHVYTEPGTFTVVYRATDDSQTTGTATLSIQVINPAPTITRAELTTQAPRVGDILLFTADVEDDTVETVRFHWDFKDGVVDTRQNAIHTYNVAGTFQVTLTVTDAYGKSTDKQIAVQVLPRHADASGGSDGDNPGQEDLEPPLSRLDQQSPGVPVIGLLAALGVAFAWRRR